MPDDNSNRGPADRSRVNVHEDYERRYWCEKWNVTEQQLRERVQRVGVRAADGAGCLGKPAP
jgi:hypothetical protein